MFAHFPTASSATIPIFALLANWNHCRPCRWASAIHGIADILISNLTDSYRPRPEAGAEAHIPHGLNRPAGGPRSPLTWLGGSMGGIVAMV